MPNAELSRRVEKLVGSPPLRDMARERREFREALLEADHLRICRWRRNRRRA
jgi:hypothetical protein